MSTYYKDKLKSSSSGSITAHQAKSQFSIDWFWTTYINFFHKFFILIISDYTFKAVCQVSAGYAAAEAGIQIHWQDQIMKHLISSIIIGGGGGF